MHRSYDGQKHIDLTTATCIDLTTVKNTKILLRSQKHIHRSDTVTSTHIWLCSQTQTLTKMHIHTSYHSHKHTHLTTVTNTHILPQSQTHTDRLPFRWHVKVCKHYLTIIYTVLTLTILMNYVYILIVGVWGTGGGRLPMSHLLNEIKINWWE